MDPDGKNEYDNIIKYLREKYGLNYVEITPLDVDIFKMGRNLKEDQAVCKVFHAGGIVVCVTKSGLIIEDLFDIDYDESKEHI